MAEWSIAAVLKTVDSQGSGGSNPSLSASLKPAFSFGLRAFLLVFIGVCGEWLPFRIVYNRLPIFVFIVAFFVPQRSTVFMQKRDDRGIAVTKVRGVVKYCANITLPNKKRKKAYFNTKEEARVWLKQYKMSLGVDLSDFAALSKNQLADIRVALKKLPDGYSLTKCVEIVASKYVSTRSLTDCIADFIKLKESVSITGGYLTQIKTRVSALLSLRNFESITAEKLLEALSQLKNRRGNFLAPKTKKHYLAIWSEFFDWCETRGYIKKTPFRQIHSSDKPKLVKSNPQAASIEVVEKFFAEAETELILSQSV